MSDVGAILTDAASIAIAGGGAAGLVGWIIRKAWLGLARVRRFLDDYEGTPARPGIPERPGVMTRLQSIDHRLANGDLRFEALDERNTLLDQRHARVDAILAHLAEEMPKNGRPMTEKVDAIYRYIQSLDAAADPAPTPASPEP
ncbi:MAG: hypothetical protein ACTHMS_13210 [Jatrophihabitans sp.]|uniref:hypothetical protein n=1 Tax=Jatrophihabitans sp. TaxID=1932789 RepID=UPI003F82031D